MTLLLGFSFLFALGAFVMFIGVESLQNEYSGMKQYIMPFFGVIICFLAFWTVYSYCRNSPKVTINNSNLKIGKESFKISCIKDVALSGKMPFPLIIDFPMEGLAILFNDGKEKFLYDDMYINSNEVKLFLEQVVVKKEAFKPITSEKIDSKALRFQDEIVFKGNQFTSLRGISLWSLLSFFMFIILINIGKQNIGVVIFFLLFGGLLFALFSWLMHFVGLTKDFLIIRNHNFIWKEIIYRLSYIKEIVFESQGNQPNCIRVITNDFKSKLYPAATLTDKMWLDLKRKLERKGVKVRNECVF